ncbi:MAG: cupin domain-containing protein [Deltaproteobacteria bacterium]|nr:cupin domain-containing protein [Deltaproteobacteria bacterium]
MKPLMNLDEVKVEGGEPTGSFQQHYGLISSEIGAKKLGYNLTICPPGKTACPYHNHHANEEMFFILEGEGTLRFGDEEYPLRKHDIIACPPGKRHLAHEITNTGKTDLKYLALSTKEHTEVCEYPDSNKVSITVGDYGDWDMRLISKADQGVDYFEGEERAK